jgi:hypothetical protein
MTVGEELETANAILQGEHTRLRLNQGNSEGSRRDANLRVAGVIAGTCKLHCVQMSSISFASVSLRLYFTSGER